VWEWCHDWYGPYSADDQRDPLGPATGSVKAVRGGSYRSGSEISWCAFRGLCDPVLCRPDIGFRAARAGKREE
jgi:formylglycine-generating enzyme required for sulfatase activity